MLDNMVDDFDGLNSDEPMEKDGTEIELEKLVFGDESGFHEGLQSYKDANDHIRDLVEGDQQQAQGGLEEGTLKDLDDADVCNAELPVGFAIAQSCSSCSSWTPLRQLWMSQTFYLRQNQTKTRCCQTTATPRHGLIATTNASSSP